MFVLIVGCGRVGSSIAHSMLLEGHEVSVLDEDAEAIALLELLGASDTDLLARHGRWYLADRDPRWVPNPALVFTLQARFT